MSSYQKLHLGEISECNVGGRLVEEHIDWLSPKEQSRWIAIALVIYSECTITLVPMLTNANKPHMHGVLKYPMGKTVEVRLGPPGDPESKFMLCVAKSLVPELTATIRNSQEY